MNRSWSWLNGEIAPTDEAKISITDHGLTVGDGVFETMKVIAGEPFALSRHLKRLRRSLAALEFDVGQSDDQLRSAAKTVIDAALIARDEVGRIRLTVTAGPGPAGSERGSDQATVLYVTGDRPFYEVSTSVASVPFTRNPKGALAGVKSTSYAENALALARARAAGATEAIFCDTSGNLSEGTGSNIFVVKDGILMTPALSNGCLAGITRELVMENLEVAERDDLTFDDLRAADEAFLTSSTRDVQAIGIFDGQPIGLDPPGSITLAAADAIRELTLRNLDP